MRGLSQHHSTEFNETGLGREEMLAFFVFSFLWFFVCFLGGLWIFLFCFGRFWFLLVFVGVDLWGFFVFALGGHGVKSWYFDLFFLKLNLNLKLLEVGDSIVWYILKQKVQIAKLVVSASLDY